MLGPVGWSAFFDPSFVDNEGLMVSTLFQSWGKLLVLITTYKSSIIFFIGP